MQVLPIGHIVASPRGAILLPSHKIGSGENKWAVFWENWQENISDNLEVERIRNRTSLHGISGRFGHHHTINIVIS